MDIIVLLILGHLCFLVVFRVVEASAVYVCGTQRLIDWARPAQVRQFILWFLALQPAAEWLTLYFGSSIFLSLVLAGVLIYRVTHPSSEPIDTTWRFWPRAVRDALKYGLIFGGGLFALDIGSSILSGKSLPPELSTLWLGVYAFLAVLAVLSGFALAWLVMPWTAARAKGVQNLKVLDARASTLTVAALLLTWGISALLTHGVLVFR